MARLFDDASTQYLEHGAAVLTAVPFTFSCWFNSDSATDNQCLMFLGLNSSTNRYFAMHASGNAAGDPVRIFAQNGGTSSVVSTTTGYTVGTTHHACAVFESSTSRHVYIDGGSKASDTTDVTPTTPNVTTIGRRSLSTPASYFSGMIAEVAIWNIALTDVEVALLAKKISPLMVRPDSLVMYVPIMGKYSPEIDLVGGRDFTVTGATTSQHPRIMYPYNRRNRKYVVAAGGGEAHHHTLLHLIMGLSFTGGTI